MYDPIRIPFKVMQCTDYEDRRLPGFDNMKEIAWQIRTKSAGNIAGFVTVPEAEPDEATEQPEEIPAASETKQFSVATFAPVAVWHRNADVIRRDTWPA